MLNPSKQKWIKLAAGSMLAACSIFGTVSAAGAEGDGGGGGAEPGLPQPAPPNIPDDPSEGLPVPVPGGGA